MKKYVRILVTGIFLSFLASCGSTPSNTRIGDVEQCGEWSWHWNNCVGTRNYEYDRLTYTGVFKRNFPVGNGRVEYWDSDVIYIGEYSQGAPNGKGAQTNKKGFKYFEGNFSQGRREGTGTYFFEPNDPAQRLSLSGNFRQNSITHGEIVYKNGDKYIGEIDTEFQPYGPGKKIFNDGKSDQIGIFSNGVFQENIRTKEDLIALTTPYYADIRCRFGSNIFSPAICLSNLQGQRGFFKITNHGKTTEYYPIEFTQIPKKIYLGNNFEIIAQSVSLENEFEIEIFSIVTKASVFKQTVGYGGVIKVKN